MYFILLIATLFQCPLYGKNSTHLSTEQKKTVFRGINYANKFLNRDYCKSIFSKHDSKKAIISFHGLGDYAHSRYTEHFSTITDATVFVPDMPYSLIYLNSKRGIIGMGGLADLATAFKTLKKVADSGYEKIGLYGFSCGGAVVINILYALQNPTKFSDFFKILDIDPIALKSKIKGCIIDRPFTSYENAARAITGNFIGSLASMGGYRENVKRVFNSCYKDNNIMLDGIEALKSASAIKDMPLSIHAAEEDKVVGYKGVEELFKLVEKKNPTTFLKSPGGHVDPIKESIKKAWVTFFEAVFS